MKKIIVGSLLMTISPFVIIFGSMLITQLNPPESAKSIAGFIGTMVVTFNCIMGALMVLSGHNENKTFDKL